MSFTLDDSNNHPFKDISSSYNDISNNHITTDNLSNNLIANYNSSEDSTYVPLGNIIDSDDDLFSSSDGDISDITDMEHKSLSRFPKSAPKIKPRVLYRSNVITRYIMLIFIFIISVVIMANIDHPPGIMIDGSYPGYDYTYNSVEISPTKSTDLEPPVDWWWEYLISCCNQTQFIGMEGEYCSIESTPFTKAGTTTNCYRLISNSIATGSYNDQTEIVNNCCYDIRAINDIDYRSYCSITCLSMKYIN